MNIDKMLKTVKGNSDQINLPPEGSKVYVALSGGVDSAATAIILKELGYKVTGVFLICWDPKSPGCRADADKTDAVKTAAKLGISLEIIDYQKEYREKVFEYVTNEYNQSRIPNPDILCNSKIKFGCLYDQLISGKKETYLATGHYARIFDHKYLEESGINFLSRDYYIAGSFDRKKDQSYFLYDVDVTRVKHITFPMGIFKKEQIRDVVKEFGLTVWDKPDSQGVCFLGDVSLSKMMADYIANEPGDVIDNTGKVLGKHKGLGLYTIGQRHGLGIRGSGGSNVQPVYVIGKDIKSKTLIVGNRSDAYRNVFDVKMNNEKNQMSDLRNLVERSGGGIFVRIRNLGDLIKCELSFDGESFINVRTKEPIFAVNPGQHAVFYFEDIIIGGGVIKS